MANPIPLEQLLSNPFQRMERELKRREILRVFGPWLAEAETELILSLYPFATRPPLRYLDWRAFETTLRFLESDASRVLDVLGEQSEGLTHAIQSAVREGASWRRDGSVSSNRPTELLEFEQVWHPEYQRYVEHVYNHLIGVPLAILGIRRSRDYLQAPFPTRVQTLANHSLADLAVGYNPIVRNAISHGSTYFGQDEITYKDKSQTTTLGPHDFLSLFDSLVDNCHGIVAALLTFVSRNWQAVEVFGLHRLPLGLRALCIQGVASHRAFSVDAITEQAAHEKWSMLLAHCHSRSRAAMIHLFEAIGLGSAAQRIGGQHYSSFAISVSCGPSVPSQIIVKGAELRVAREYGTSLDELPAIVTDPLLWHDASNLARRLFIFKTVFSLAWDQVRAEVAANWRSAGLKVWRTRYTIRHVQNKSVGTLRRLQAELVLQPNETLSPEQLIKLIHHAVRRLRRVRLRQLTFEKHGLFSRHPSYVWIRVHRRDRRLRQLDDTSTNAENVIATAEWVDRCHRRKPITVKHPDTVFRNVRIVFGVPRQIIGAVST